MDFVIDYFEWNCFFLFPRQMNKINYIPMKFWNISILSSTLSSSDWDIEFLQLI